MSSSVVTVVLVRGGKADASLGFGPEPGGLRLEETGERGAGGLWRKGKSGFLLKY